MIQTFCCKCNLLQLYLHAYKISDMIGGCGICMQHSSLECVMCFGKADVHRRHIAVDSLLVD